MKKIFVLFLIVLFVSCSRTAYLFTSFREPANEGLRLLYSYDGRQWTDLDTTFLKPTVGQQKVMRDPSMVQGPDGTFHLVWTTGWRGDKGFGYASSRDLLHWSAEQFIPVMEHEPSTVNVWAPELFYDVDSARYILIWASTIPRRFARGIESDSNNHRMYVTTTKDFKTFTPTRLFFDPGFSVIDATIVKRKAHDYVLVLKDNTRKELDLKVAFSTSPLGTWSNVSPAFTDTYSEGPTTVKLGDKWLVYYDAYRKKIYAASETKDFVTFRDVTNEVHLPERHKHGTIVPVKRKTIKQLLSVIHHN